MPKRHNRLRDREARERVARETLAEIDARSEQGPQAFEAFQKTARRVVAAPKPTKGHP
jgi:hypothetical protein